jgi:hypothetical protein
VLCNNMSNIATAKQPDSHHDKQIMGAIG